MNWETTSNMYIKIRISAALFNTVPPLPGLLMRSEKLELEEIVCALEGCIVLPAVSTGSSLREFEIQSEDAPNAAAQFYLAYRYINYSVRRRCWWSRVVSRKQ